MTSLAVTPANVRPGDSTVSTVKMSFVTAGETVDAGDTVYKKDSDGEWYRASATTSEETAGQYGIGVALTNAGDGEPLLIQTKGEYTSGATLVAGETYVVGATATGDIAPVADITTGWYVTHLGFASDTSKLNLLPRVTGVQR